MGWKGALRSFNAARRAHERQVRRDLREAERRAKEDLKRQELELAQEAVQRYELQLRLLGSVQHDCGPTINWTEFASMPLPDAPSPSTKHTAAAEAALVNYRPGFFARLFGGEKKVRARLAAELESAKQADAAETHAARAAHVEKCQDIEDCRQLAQAILRGDVSRYCDALAGADSFEELQEVAVSVDATALRADLVWVRIVLPPPDAVVPSQQLSLTKSGKLSTKAMPKGRANEIYQDYACGAALRACREVLAALPVAWCGVNVQSELLNPSNGHVELSTILSVIVPRRTAEGLRYESIDPSDAMKNFLHRMGFKKSAGMAPVDPLTSADLPVQPRHGAGIRG